MNSQSSLRDNAGVNLIVANRYYFATLLFPKAVVKIQPLQIVWCKKLVTLYTGVSVKNRHNKLNWWPSQLINWFLNQT